MLDVTGTLDSFSAEPLVPVAQASGDAQLVELWLHGRSAHTQRAYRADATAFLLFVARPLPSVTVANIQAWLTSLAGLAPTSRHTRCRRSKSLFGFGHRLGYLPFDVGRVVQRPKLKDTLAEGILAEGEVQLLLVTAGQKPPRQRTAPRSGGLDGIMSCCGCSTPAASGPTS